MQWLTAMNYLLSIYLHVSTCSGLWSARVSLQYRCVEAKDFHLIVGKKPVRTRTSMTKKSKEEVIEQQGAIFQMLPLGFWFFARTSQRPINKCAAIHVHIVDPAWPCTCHDQIHSVHIYRCVHIMCVCVCVFVCAWSSQLHCDQPI